MITRYATVTPPTRVKLATDFYGIKLDFNYGARVLLPQGIKARVKISDFISDVILLDEIGENTVLMTKEKFFVKYHIEIWYQEKYFEYIYNDENKNIKIDVVSNALGDTLAWINDIDRFRIEHKCNVYVTVDGAFISLLQTNYPNLNFVNKNFIPKECYAIYYIGYYPKKDAGSFITQKAYSEMFPNMAKNILGLDDDNSKTHLIATERRKIKDKYVCIATKATLPIKWWNEQGWNDVIAFLKTQGYRVLCIDRNREETVENVTNIFPETAEDFTGDFSLQERVNILKYADFFIGLSSGLSWLAWACDVPVVMISGFTLPANEFKNRYRIINTLVCHGCWNIYGNGTNCLRTGDNKYICEKAISSKQVVEMIKKVIKNEIK